VDAFSIVHVNSGECRRRRRRRKGRERVAVDDGNDGDQW